MPKQTCPNCGTTFSSERGWANAALSVLMPAPAIPDMATQVRCPRCGHVFADSEVRPFAASPHSARNVLIVVLVLAATAWALSQLL